MIMKKKKLLLSRLFPFFISVYLLNMTSLTANACPTGRPRDISYIRRDNNRCEGILDSRPISNNFELVAFSSSNLTNYPDTLKIRVPGTGRDKPIISIQSYTKNYRLDEVEAIYRDSGFIFDLKTNTILQRVKIPFNSLLPLAFVEKNSRRIYYPVILEQPSNAYKFVIYTRNRRTFPKVEISQNGRIIPSNLQPRNIPKRGQITFDWQPRNNPAGTYQFYLEDGNGRSISFSFKHDLNWL
ncbi:hypothetical protein CwatDRAFT_6254 [Crocosphaera watsonii WH 8501]|uniref:Uncharacterized protein n=2 Tax=Crocosphaera watsonii TaxID=263511 RepID=Q4C9X8_CROWT|nr:hypothetical protein CwatDRAFT_6254 [Crocosphaera watsonii WH 8501]